jgi:hypothetical protein
MPMTAQKTARLQHLAAKVHALGPRPLFEILRELEDGADLMARLERYAMLSPDIVAALGANRMPPRARMIGGAR